MKQTLKNSLFLRTLLAFMIILPAALASRAQQESLYDESYLLPPEDIQDFLTRNRHTDTLNLMSPDRNHFMIPVGTDFTSLQKMSQKTYRLGMLEICPDVNREWRLSTGGIIGLKIFSLSQRSSLPVEIPEGAFISDMTWSPDGKSIAFLAHLPKGSQVWTTDTASGKSKPLNKAFVMATLSGTRGYGSSGNASKMLQWTPNGTVITLLVPENRGPEPEENRIPGSPIIRRTREKATPTPTYPFLLRTPHDKELFKYYTTSQMVELIPGKAPRKIGPPAMYMRLSLSPDGKYILTENLTEPFSYIVSYSSFPRELKVLDLTGNILATVLNTPLKETSARNSGRDESENLPRDIKWRPDGKGLSLLWREPGKKEKDESEENDEKDERYDRIMLLAPPFVPDQATTLARSKKRFQEISYPPSGRYAIAKISGEGEDGTSGTDIAAFDLTQDPAAKLLLLKDIETKDPVKLPGEIMLQTTGNGIEYTLLSSSGEHLYLAGQGYKEELIRRPFIDRIKISTGEKNRIFESSAETYELPLVYPDNDLEEIIISRENRTVFPNSYLWKRDHTVIPLTNNQNPYPELEACRRIEFDFTRRDGLKIHGNITLPLGYSDGTRIPAVFWTYPREYATPKDYRRAATRSRNHNAFSHFSTRNASQIWLIRGYAVVEPDIPILGEDGRYNNNYVAHMVDSMYAAIRKLDQMNIIDVDKLGHGGHSYGAFATANILARTPFFKAGIAGDGAFNRTLTPMSFQSERRFLWDAPDVYLEMSPFFQADHLDTPLLMYHGAADNNTGTFLIQSERFMQALTGLGKNAVLYIYPFESHGPRCLETYMDMWARWLQFFDKYVKNSTG